MKKIKFNNVSYSEYNSNNAFEVAQSIWDEYIEHEDKSYRDINKILSDLLFNKCLSNFGKDVKQSFEFINGLVATNKGLPLEIINNYIEFFLWQFDNDINIDIIDKTRINMEEMCKNNNIKLNNLQGNIKRKVRFISYLKEGDFSDFR